MTLTEEQRAALKRVVAYMDEMYAIASPYHGCTEDANILRAMIDSSEQFNDATKLIGFDLERARGLRDFLQDDCAEVWDVWAEMIAEIERLRAIIDTPSEEPEWVVDFKKLNRFAGAGYSLIDIEIAKKWHTAYRKAQNSNLLRKQEIERLREALDESERVVAHKTKSAAHWYDEHLQARADRVQTRRVVEQQAARIKALEGREEDLFTCYNCGKKVDDVEPGPILGEIHFDPGYLGGQYEPPEPACAYFVCVSCLNAEGKIGPDADAKPHCWQITEERKAAIKELSELLTAIGCPSCHYYIQKNYGEDITVLRAMLTEAE